MEYNESKRIHSNQFSKLSIILEQNVLTLQNIQHKIATNFINSVLLLFDQYFSCKSSLNIIPA